MLPAQLAPEQEAIVQAPLQEGQGIFLSGPPGAGKSTALVARLVHLLRQGVPAYSILVLLPDRATRDELQKELKGLQLGPYGDVSLLTYYGLAHQMVSLFWPLVARRAGFAHPERPPIFYNFELAQDLMRHMVEPLLEQGYFEKLHLHPLRLVAQLIDNMNQSALNGYPLPEVLLRLVGSWSGPAERLLAFQQGQEIVSRFRAEALEHGLLDFSLMLEVLQQHLLDAPPFWGYFTERYRHLLVDNVEENVPAAHDFIGRLLPQLDSALLVYDEFGGNRSILGADPEGALALRRSCSRLVRMPGPPRPTALLAQAAAVRLGQEEGTIEGAEGAVLDVIRTRYRSEMAAAAADALGRMVHGEHIPPSEIAVIAPALDGVLRFALAQECARVEVPVRFLRRSRRPIEEPAVRAVLNLAALLHPEWDVYPQRYEIGEALGQVMAEVDPVRAALLADWTYDPVVPGWRAPDSLTPTARNRLGVHLLAHYQQLWERWQALLPAAGLPWEDLLARMQQELLPDATADPTVAVAFAELLESARNFRQTFPVLYPGDAPELVGRRYLEMLRSGLAGAYYVVPEEEIPPAVVVAPVHSYLLGGRPVRRQLWLDLGSPEWSSSLQQPLTNPHVLSRRWPVGAPWDDAADYAARRASLARIVQGLCYRCSEGVILCSSELSTAGQPQEGPLLRLLEPILERWEKGTK